MKHVRSIALALGRIIVRPSRALTASDTLPTPTNLLGIMQRREISRQRIEESIGLHRIAEIASGTARLYLPEQSPLPGPAVILLRPHDDPQGAESSMFIGSLGRLGFGVVVLDGRAYHDRLGLFGSGVTPEGLIQHEVRSALAYLRSRPDIDKDKIGIVGSGFPVLLAAALNSEFTAVVSFGEIPDFNAWIKSLRDIGETPPDTCNLIPGLLRYGSTRDVVAMIAPRPLLSLGTPPRVYEQTAELYQLFGANQSLHQTLDAASAQDARYAAYRWLIRWLGKNGTLDEFSERATILAPDNVQLGAAEPLKQSPRRPFVITELSTLLGGVLPEARTSIRLQPAK